MRRALPPIDRNATPSAKEVFAHSSGRNVFADLGLPHAEERLRLARKFAGKPALFLAACLALAGCTTTRYVPTPCLTAEQYAKLEAALPPKVSDRLTGKADEDVKIIAASGVRLRGYIGGLMTILKGCSS